MGRRLAQFGFLWLVWTLGHGAGYRKASGQSRGWVGTPPRPNRGLNL